jgi:hypothetical protein
MKGDATTGSLTALRTNADAADLYVRTHKPNDTTGQQLHDILNNMQAVLVDGIYSSLSYGISDAVAGWNSDIDALLP